MTHEIYALKIIQTEDPLRWTVTLDGDFKGSVIQAEVFRPPFTTEPAPLWSYEARSGARSDAPRWSDKAAAAWAMLASQAH